MLFVLFASFLIVPATQIAFADTNRHTVSVNRVANAGPATIEIDYSVDFDFTRPSSVLPGESVNLSLEPRSGRMVVTVDVAGQSYSVQKDLPLGSQVSFDVAPGIEAYVSTSASAFADIRGPVNTRSQSFSWSDQYPERFTLYVSSDASSNDEIVVRVPVKIGINLGANLDLFVFKRNLGSIPLGLVEAYPVIEERIPVGFVFPTAVVAVVAIIGIVGVIAVIIAKKRSRKPKPRQSSSESVSDYRSPMHSTPQIRKSPPDDKSIVNDEPPPPADHRKVKTIKELELEKEQKRTMKLSDDLKNRMLEEKISEETYKELKRELEERALKITSELDEIKKKGEFAREYSKSTVIKKKNYSGFGAHLKAGERISGTITADGEYLFFLTNHEHIKKFEKKKRPEHMEFYENIVGRSSDPKSFTFDCLMDEEYLLIFLNPGKKELKVTVDYVIENQPPKKDN